MTTEPLTTFTLEDKVSLFVDEIFSFDETNDIHAHKIEKIALEIGKHIRLRAATKSKLLNKPLNELHKQMEKDESITNNLDALRNHIESLNPSTLYEAQGWLSRMVQKLPYIEKPIQKYLGRLKEGQATIEQIQKELKAGIVQLEKDNDILKNDQAEMYALRCDIDESIAFATAINQEALKRLPTLSPTKCDFLNENFIFPLSQRILDLQQQHSVFHQGSMSIKIIINNNKQLIQSIERSLGVTLSALQVATGMAFALSHQKDLLDKVQSVNKTTSDLIEMNSINLKQQGITIQKQSTEAMLDMNKLRTSLSNLNEAIEDINQFRRDSITTMQASIEDYQVFISETLTKITADGASKK